MDLDIDERRRVAAWWRIAASPCDGETRTNRATNRQKFIVVISRQLHRANAVELTAKLANAVMPPIQATHPPVLLEHFADGRPREL
jgi:hypothetical protein